MGNTTYKILANIILGKIKPYTEKITRDYQNGFRDGRSVTDNIFALKIINEKIWECNQNAHYLFIDFQKANDSIQRDTLWKCLEEFKIPKILINMCRKCVQKTRSAVRIEGILLSFSDNKSGLKQGDSVSPILSNLALQQVIQSIKVVPSGIKTGKEQLNVLAYSDDIVLIGKNEIELRQLFVEIENTARKSGRHINQGKNKIYDKGKEKQFKKK